MVSCCSIFSTWHELDSAIHHLDLPSAGNHNTFITPAPLYPQLLLHHLQRSILTRHFSPCSMFKPPSRASCGHSPPRLAIEISKESLHVAGNLPFSVQKRNPPDACSCYPTILEVKCSPNHMVGDSLCLKASIQLWHGLCEICQKDTIRALLCFSNSDLLAIIFLICVKSGRHQYMFCLAVVFKSDSAAEIVFLLLFYLQKPDSPMDLRSPEDAVLCAIGCNTI